MTQDASPLRDTLIGSIHSGRWRPGDRLPTERALGAQFGIGRSAVRRVLATMKAQGFIVQTVGSGTYVAAAPPAAPAMIATTAEQLEPALRTSPAELMEARLAMEPAIVDLVIRNASATDFSTTEACCTRAEAAETLEAFEHWDGALHQAIAEATHNTLVISVFQMMTRIREHGEWGLLKKQSLTPERRAAYQHEHRLLVAALKRRDADAARAATSEHLTHVRRNLLGY